MGGHGPALGNSPLSAIVGVIFLLLVAGFIWWKTSN